ncbi:MAG: DNA mismatch repair endonuclease MutL [Puniceicoccales bacterium]|jgi:DNA mismatch repair protein MutL|nr:DNA mismatch repair endonuclease MutL [Puniceicoccales bacterium]
MATIHLLPETIINQIAAGEVIERPASIIKELIENSIDAKAKHIVVKFNGGGDAFLSIADDGIGMNEEDAALAFERNATSKLMTIKDLEVLQTFGFRGEAIASIASVAQVLMQTNDGSGGTEIRYDSGKKIYQKMCSCNCGTLIEIRNLFEKIPARKQFLKSISTEATHIIKVMRTFILAEPNIRFELYKNGKLIFVSPESKDLKERTEILFGHFDQYITLDHQSEHIHLKGILFEPAVDGLVTKPDFLIFVNRRHVTNLAIMRIVRDTYAMIKSQAINVGAFLFLNFYGNFVDFNVHPQKKEVRFKSDYLVKNFLENAITDALRKKIGQLRISGKEPDTTFKETPSSTQLASPEMFSVFRKNIVGIPLHYRNTHRLGNAEQKIAEKSYPSPMDRNSFSENETEIPCRIFQLSYEQNLKNFPQETLPDDRLLWRFIGTFWEGKFAIFESDTGLIFIDLFAMQKCIFLDKFLRSIDNFPSQLLLMPRMITVDAERAMAIDAILELFSNFGIEIENFGKNTYKIIALPREISEDMMIQLLQDDTLLRVDRLLTREILAKKICSCLQFQPISFDEIRPFVSQLLRCRQFLISPMGTNVLFEIDRCDLEKKFGLQSVPKQYI